MKRFILLAVCVSAMFGFSASSADPVCGGAVGSDVCVEAPSYVYEACAWSHLTSTYTEACADANNNAGYDGYAYSYGMVAADTWYYVDNWINDGYIGFYDDLIVTCLSGHVNANDMSYGGGTC